MDNLYPLSPRAISTGLAQRTIKNLLFIKHAYENGNDVHVVTQVVNSLLCLLVFPVEKEEQFFYSFGSVPLINPPDFQAVSKCLPGFPSIPSLTIYQFEASKNLRRFFKRLRNAIAHRRLEFSGDERDLAEVLIDFQDATDSDVDWHITLSAQDLMELSFYIANEIIDQRL
jgi:hypothetical protein